MARIAKPTMALVAILALAGVFGGKARATTCVTGNVFANNATGIAYADFTVAAGCSPTVSLVSYRASSYQQFPNNLPVQYFASKTEQNLSPGHYTFPAWQIAQPDNFCYYEVDLVEGGVIYNLSATNNYGAQLVNSSWGGVNYCAFPPPPPPPTPSSAQTPAETVDMAVTALDNTTVQVTNAISDAASSTGSELVIHVPASFAATNFTVSSANLAWQPACAWGGQTATGETVLTCKLGEMDPFQEAAQTATVAVVGSGTGAISANVQPAVVAGVQQMDDAEGNNRTANWTSG